MMITVFRKMLVIIGVVISVTLGGVVAHAGREMQNQYIPMAGPGEKISIGNDAYIIYGFVEKPKIGPIIMKVRIFNKAGEKDTSYVVAAESWMPSMPEMKSGNDTFKLSKNGDYLTPIRISMLGDWEVKFTISKDGKVIYRGSYKFDV